MELSDLQVFLAVERAGGITKAASGTHDTTPVAEAPR
jgi:DNA-binding transcriptional LysR family regulator